MAKKVWNIAVLGFGAINAKRIGMVLSERIKNRPDFAYMTDVQSAPIDICVLDMGDQQALPQYEIIRKLWPAAITVCVSDSGDAGKGPFKIDRANMFVKLRPVIESALESSAIAQGQLPDNRLVPLARSGQISGQLSALVVDDSATVRQQVTGALARIGFSAEEAADGDMALTKAKLKAYHLYVLDIEMPGIDGYTLTKRLQELDGRPRAPIIILSSRSSAIDRVRGALSGSDSYLVKPINLKDLYAAVDTAMLKANGGNRDALIGRGYRLNPG
jgi:CheY-like chemotaxis protein